MKKGSRLFSFAAKNVVVDSVYCFRTDTATTVYNLEVKGNENYYVSASKVLVHNCNTGLKLEKSISRVMGNTYKAMGEVSVPIKNTDLLKKLNVTSKGSWVKVYEAGLNNGNKIEIHYFRNNKTGEVFNVKTKYNYWQNKAFKKLGK